ncbi:MAG: crotonobetainyl-CoA:carnitine CoA-transferase CaiB-like acyl-CoA transferase [Bacteroidia bacterium]|jgi:crotonobetainyl-CoA:carnitine CoA-transferase CaiB-like acyl-CoA transferase
MNETFKGLRVIELATVLAGPTVGMFFAELGAEVIKIENPRLGGDITRKWKLGSEDSEKDYSAYFCSVNWGKQHVFADLKTEEGKQQVHNLVKDADIVLSNFRAGDDVKLQMDPEMLLAIKPDLIIGKISGYGNESSRPAFDVVLQAEAGYMFMNGQPGSDPSKMPVALIDVLAAHQLKEALLIALLHKEKTGNGSVVSVSLFDAAVSALTNQASNWLMAGHIPKQMGSLHPNIAPYGEILTCADGTRIVLAIGSAGQLLGLCSVLNLLELISDQRFATEQSRVENREELFKLLSAKASKINGKDLLDQFLKEVVPAGEIRNMEQVFEQEAAQKLVKEEIMSDGTISNRVSDIAFKIWEK